ncbi:hypothetical protein [Desulfosporosinus nitroreducens]|uniref:Uncharacterized protein n=1 Tax=Desulfosporosinus nitroreducens TaxID=2018668 RepID=A0ABT8QMT3_9FIRM|nr:hypothetical protein [Desulfosporosinus nitroreducens]MDO0822639.1 hypothetical protein [Desulfosporosinus nitroreducens]
MGEEPIYGMNFEDIAEVQLEGIIDFESDKDPLETNDWKWAKRVRLKSTLSFVELADKYLQQMPNTIFEPADYTFGRFTAQWEWIKQRFDAYSKHPVKQRLQMIADDILDRFGTENYYEDISFRIVA